jgi:cyclohexadienyl dehydratase
VRFRWPELTSDLQAGRFDLAMSGVTVRPDRSLVGRFSLPVATSGAMLLVAPGLEGRGLAELDDPAISIAVNAGGHLERVTRARFTRATITPIPDNSGVLPAVVEGRAQVAVTDTQEISYWRARHPELRAVGPFTRDRKAYLARTEIAERLADLDQWLLEAEADGRLAELRREHLGPEHARIRPAAPLEALLASMDERLALMPWVAEVKRARGLAISHPDQEQRVIEAALAAVDRAAGASGFGTRPPPAAIRAFFRTQIEAAKQIQQHVLEGDPRVSEEPLPDLGEELRPALIRIGDRIAMLLTRLPPDLETHVVAAATRRALAGHSLGAARIDDMADAIVALSRLPGVERSSAP